MRVRPANGTLPGRQNLRSHRSGHLSRLLAPQEISALQKRIQALTVYGFALPFVAIGRKRHPPPASPLLQMIARALERPPPADGQRSHATEQATAILQVLHNRPKRKSALVTRTSASHHHLVSPHKGAREEAPHHLMGDGERPSRQCRPDAPKPERTCHGLRLPQGPSPPAARRHLRTPKGIHQRLWYAGSALLRRLVPARPSAFPLVALWRPSRWRSWLLGEDGTPRAHGSIFQPQILQRRHAGALIGGALSLRHAAAGALDARAAPLVWIDAVVQPRFWPEKNQEPLRATALGERAALGPKPLALPTLPGTRCYP